MACATDAEYISIVRRLRWWFPRPNYLITAAVWSTGAYGRSVFINSTPQSDHTGISVRMLWQVRRGRGGGRSGRRGGGAGLPVHPLPACAELAAGAALALQVGSQLDMLQIMAYGELLLC